MPFFPDSAFGLAYLAALCGATYFARKGSWAIIGIMWAHWLTMRTIDVVDRDNLWFWMGQDVAMIVAFTAFARSRVWYAMASVFFLGLICDQLAMAFSLVFEAHAAMGEFIGYLGMTIMVGGAGHGIRLLGPVGSVGARLVCGISGHSPDLLHVAQGGALPPLSGMPAKHDPHGNHLASKNSAVKQ